MVPGENTVLNRRDRRDTLKFFWSPLRSLRALR